MKAPIGFKAFSFFGSVSVRFRCVCEIAFTVVTSVRICVTTTVTTTLVIVVATETTFVTTYGTSSVTALRQLL